nr:MAG TPA: hypothetical protein [Caudoviricetes sp.]
MRGCIWEFVYTPLYQKRMQKSTLLKCKNMRSQRCGMKSARFAFFTNFS